jgi:hypothetical protein
MFSPFTGLCQMRPPMTFMGVSVLMSMMMNGASLTRMIRIVDV